MNALAIVRGDLRARLGTRKGLAVCAAYTAAVWLLGLLGTGPERGGESPLWVASVGLLVVVGYVVTAAAGAEIAFPGEKGVLDLVVSPFSAAEVAWGKALSDAVFAALCTAATWPVLVFLHALRGSPWPESLAQAAVLLAVSWGFGGVATWLSAAVESEVSRSVLLWGGLAGFLAGAGLVGPWPWHPVHAVRPFGPAWARAACAASLVAVGALGFWGVYRQVVRLRKEA
ncbi:MAG: hypothetical protein RMM30_06790 [Armatimonadota bacterium]|nr:hypothetical protein [Armatimonadota bacterium]MDW8156276.1 hypothetical protein [Armatimonadota bacterium]